MGTWPQTDAARIIHRTTAFRQGNRHLSLQLVCLRARHSQLQCKAQGEGKSCWQKKLIIVARKSPAGMLQMSLSSLTHLDICRTMYARWFRSYCTGKQCPAEACIPVLTGIPNIILSIDVIRDLSSEVGIANGLLDLFHPLHSKGVPELSILEAEVP